MYKATLDYWNPTNKSVVTSTGFHYLDTSSAVSGTKYIESTTEIGLFEQFYKLNNSLRYCNGSFYKFQNKEQEQKYQAWLKSDDYKKKSFSLYYGNGVVD